MHVLTILLLGVMCPCTLQSGAVSDLALLTRAEKEHPVTSLKSPLAESSPLPAVPEPLSMVVKSERMSEAPAVNLLSLWRVKILLALLIVAILGSLAVAGVYTVRVFGCLLDEKSSIEDGVESSSLQRLLESHASRYGSLFADRKEAIIVSGQ